MIAAIIVYAFGAFITAMMVALIEDDIGMGVVSGAIWPVILAGKCVEAVPKVMEQVRDLYK